ncbi:MAG: S24 family peptidase [Candidatus Binatus sp.]|jgi:phage repressor protein C with HTH and peptisase S24 domain|uniref:XRE family transcriptional regulator n=1 Tax=Candidatus Binatus sp. TaxID=2811406 RepID=UPI003C82EF11
MAEPPTLDEMIAASSGDQAAFAPRLRLLIQRHGSVLGLAKAAHLKNSSIHLWLGGSEPSREKLVKLANGAGVSVEWLATGRGPMVADLLPEYLLIPRYKGESKVEYQGVDYLALKKDWIRSLPGAPSAEALLLTDAAGDAMAPYIQSGDLILINTSDRDLRDGVWALMAPIAGLTEVSSSGIPRVLLRRIRAEGGGKFRLFCDNKDFESPPGQTVRSAKRKGVVGGDLVAIVSDEKKIFGVVGRVIWKGSTIP